MTPDTMMRTTRTLLEDEGPSPREFAYYDDLLAVALGPNSSSSWEALSPQFHIDSDLVLLQDPRNNTATNDTTSSSSLRIAPILNLAQSQFFGDSEFWDTTHLAMAAAVHDFNARVNPYDETNHTTTAGRECNLYLSMRWAIPRRNLGRNLNVVNSYQSEVLLGGNGTRPLAVLGGITSTQSSLLGILGAVATEIDPGASDGWEGSSASHVFVNQQGVPNLSPFSTAVALDDFDFAPLFSRTVPSNDPDVRALCRYLHDVLGVKRLGILYVNTVYGSSYFSSLKLVADEYKMELLSFSFDPVPNFDFNETYSELKASRVTYMVAALHPPTWRDIVRTLLDARLLDNPDYAWFFTDSLSPAIGSHWTETGDDTADATYPLSSRQMARALNRTSIVRLSSTTSQLERHTEHLLKYTVDPKFVDYFRNKTGVNLSTMTLQPSIYSMLAYDAVQTTGLAACRSNDTFLRGPDLHGAITSLEFSGATGKVAFNTANTRVASDLMYEIANIWVDDIDGNGTSFVTRSDPCVLVNGDGRLTMSCNLMFPSGSTIPPDSLPPVQEELNLIPLGVSIFVWILAGAVILLALGFAAWTYICRDKPVVRASQPAFLVILCVGTILVAFDMVFVPFQDPPMSHVPCMASAWFLAIGFTTVFSALFAKTWRILRVYGNARRFRRVAVRARDVVWPIALLLALNVVVLSLWTTLDPLEWERLPVTTNKYGQVTSSRGTCLHVETNSSTDWIFFGLLLALNVVALLLSNYVSFKARLLPSDFNESKHIFLSNVILLEAFIIGTPVLLMVRNMRGASVALVRALLNAILCLGVLLPIFIPKFTKVR